jgi:uncharacterized membrane protein
MADSIYALLNFPSDDPVLSNNTMEMADDVKLQMNLAPNLVNSWQQEDIANDDTGDYFINPCQLGNDTTNAAATLVLTAGDGNNMSGNTSEITNLLYTAWHQSNTLLHLTVPAFEYHTQRMSNMQSMGSDMTNPHYELSTGYGKVLTFITNKTDGIQNNSVMLGSFGSILAANAISANANTFLTIAQNYANTINVTTTDDGLGGTITTYSSYISLANAQILADTANSIHTMMTTYRTQDTEFFTNSKAVMESYSKVSGFSRLGQTETDLIMNHIGSDKLKTRLSSES